MESHMFVFCSLMVVLGFNCEFSIDRTLKDITLSEGDTYRLECDRPSVEHTLQVVKFEIVLRLGWRVVSERIGGPFVLSNEDVLDNDIEDDNRYNVERKTDFLLVFTLTDVEWLDQGTFGCIASHKVTGGYKTVKQRVTIPGPINRLDLIKHDPRDIRKGTIITEEIRVGDSDPLYEFDCRVNTTNSLPLHGFDIQMNGVSIEEMDVNMFSNAITANFVGPHKRYGDGTYVLLYYPFTEVSRHKDKKSVYTCFTPTREGGELRASFTVALEYEPEYIAHGCTQERDIIGKDTYDHIVTCHVRAYPFATPLWTVGSDFINTTSTPDKYDIFQKGSYHNTSFSLRIFNVTQSDYQKPVTFQAINIVGFSQQQWINLDEDAPISYGNTFRVSVIKAIVLSFVTLINIF